MKAARVAAFVLLGLIGAGALMPERWAAGRYDQQFRAVPDAPPSAQFPLGTDAVGRDRLSRLLYGTRVSLLLAPAAALLSCLAAGLLGGIAGYAGGFADRAIVSAADFFLSVPWLLLLLIVRACLPLDVSPEASLAITFALLGLMGWAAPARIVRAAVAALMDSEFVLMAQARGCSPWRVLLRQLLPNVTPVLLAQFWIAVPAYILTETTLGMLGLGVAEPMPSWGGLLREIEGVSPLDRPYLLAPAILLAAVIGSLQLILPKEDFSI